MPAAVVTGRRPFLGMVGALAVTVLAVSGCSAGQDAQTAEQTSVVDGTAFQAGQVDLRDVGLVSPPVGPSFAAGSNAFLEGLMVNNATSSDRLVSITSPAATSVVFYNNQAEALLGLAPTSSASASSSDSASPTATTVPSDGATPTANTGSPTQGGTSTESASQPPSASASTSAAVPPDAISEIPLPTNQSVQFGYQSSQVAIVFVGLTAQLFPSQTFPITFTFANGGSVTATIAVKLPVGGTLDAPTIDTEPSE